MLFCVIHVLTRQDLAAEYIYDGFSLCQRHMEEVVKKRKARPTVSTQDVIRGYEVMER